MTSLRPSRVAWGFGLAIAAAGLAFDPRAEAADPKRALGLVVAALAAGLALVRHAPRAPASWAARAGMGFVAMSGLSLAWGIPAGARELATYVCAVGTGALAAQLGVRSGRALAGATATILGGVAGAWAIGAWLVGARGLSIHAGQGNPNWLGLLLAIALPLTWGRARAQRGNGRIWLGIVCAAETVGLALSHSRVGWGAAIVACLWIAASSLRHGTLRRAALVVVTGAVLFASRAATAEGDVPADLALRGRAWIWHASARAAATHLPFGAGLGKFGHAYLDAQGRDLAKFKPQEASRRFVNATTAHDDYLQAATESGPLAALLLVWALLLGVRSHARAGWQAGAASLAALSVACVGDSPLQQPAIAMIAGLLLGIPELGCTGTTQKPWKRYAPPFALLLTVAWLLVPSSRAWLSARERTRALDLEPPSRLAALTKAARIDPSSGDAALELGLHRLAMGDARGALPDLERSQTSLADVGGAIAIGSAHLALRETPAAMAAYERALDRDPGSFRAHVGMGEALFTIGDFDRADREAEIARRILPFDPRGVELQQRIREARSDL